MKQFKQADKFAPLSDIKVTTIDSFQVSKLDVENMVILNSYRKTSDDANFSVDDLLIYLSFVVLIYLKSMFHATVFPITRMLKRSSSMT